MLSSLCPFPPQLPGTAALNPAEHAPDSEPDSPHAFPKDPLLSGGKNFVLGIAIFFIWFRIHVTQAKGKCCECWRDHTGLTGRKHSEHLKGAWGDTQESSFHREGALSPRS